MHKATEWKECGRNPNSYLYNVVVVEVQCAELDDGLREKLLVGGGEHVAVARNRWNVDSCCRLYWSLWACCSSG